MYPRFLARLHCQCEGTPNRKNSCSSSPQDQNRAWIRGTVNMPSTLVRKRFECLDTMAACTRRKPPVGSSAHGGENARTRLVENQSRRPSVKSSREELELAA